MKVKIAAVLDEATDIRSYRLEPVSGGLPAFTAGSHVDVHIGAGLVRQYSICSDPADHSHYLLAVQKDPKSSGGSMAVFAQFQPGQEIEISEPRNHFKLKEEGADFVLIGGGIGVTPILAMAQRLAALGKSFHLHYLVRSADRFGFDALLDRMDLGARLLRHCDAEQGLADVSALAGAYLPGRHVYCCGPEPLMTAVKSVTRAWPPMTVHFEHFTRTETDTSRNIAFEIQLGRDGPVLAVGPDQTVLEVLREEGIVVETQCTQGLCGTCEQRVLAGEVDHRDLVLEDDEKAKHDCMMVCVSRARSKRLVLDV